MSRDLSMRFFRKRGPECFTMFLANREVIPYHGAWRSYPGKTAFFLASWD